MGSENEEPVEAALERIGSRLAHARRSRGWTHEQAAAATGLSAPYLSRIESGKRQASIATLLTLSRAYRLTLGDLVEGGGERAGQVVREADAPVRTGNGLRYRLLSSGSADLEAIHVAVPARRPEAEPYRHEGQEWLYVLSGRLRLTLGDEELLLDPGDAVTFDAGAPHRLAAAGRSDVELLLVAVAPRAALLSSYMSSAE